MVSRPPFPGFATLGGSWRVSIRSKTLRTVNGTRSDGSRAAVFPRASAQDWNRNRIMPGRLNGAATAQTPMGHWIIIAGSRFPLSRCHSDVKQWN